MTSRHQNRPNRAPPLVDYSSVEVYEFLRRSFEKEEEVCTCHRYYHNPHHLPRWAAGAEDVRAPAPQPHPSPSTRQTRGNAPRKGHRLLISHYLFFSHHHCLCLKFCLSPRLARSLYLSLPVSLPVCIFLCLSTEGAKI